MYKHNAHVALIVPESTARSRSEINRDIDADYYGYRDEEDGILLEYEKALEKELIDKLFDAPDVEYVEEKGHKEVKDTKDERKGSAKEASTEGGVVPTQKEVEAYLVQRRKQQVSIPSKKKGCSYSLMYFFFFFAFLAARQVCF